MVSIWRSISRCFSGGRFGERFMDMDVIRLGRSELWMMGAGAKAGNRRAGPRHHRPACTRLTSASRYATEVLSGAVALVRDVVETQRQRKSARRVDIAGLAQW